MNVPTNSSMESIYKTFAAIADWYLHDVGIRNNTSYAICSCLISISRTQTALKRIYDNNYYHYLSIRSKTLSLPSAASGPGTWGMYARPTS